MNGSDAPLTVQRGNTAVLSWTSNSADSCFVSYSANGKSQNVSPLREVRHAGISTVPLTESTIATIVCTGTAGKSITDSVAITVVGNGEMPQCLISAEPDVVIADSRQSQIKLTWTTSNAAKASLLFLGRQTPMPLSGSEYTPWYSMYGLGLQTLTMSAINEVGTTTCATKLNVLSPTTDLSALPTSALAELEKLRILERDAKRISDTKQLQLALELYYDSGARYPATLAELSPSFISKTPTDPLDGSAYPFDQMDGGKSYELGANLETAINKALESDDDTMNPAGTLVSPSDNTSCTGATGRYCYSVSP